MRLPAANGPAVVAFTGAARPDTYHAFGGGGSVVGVTTDGGRHWRTAHLGGFVLAVTPSVNDHGELITVVEDFVGATSAKVSTVVYVSGDGARQWRRMSATAVGVTRERLAL